MQSLVADFETEYEFVRFDIQRSKYQNLSQDYHERTMHLQKSDFSLTSDIEMMYGPQDEKGQ